MTDVPINPNPDPGDGPGLFRLYHSLRIKRNELETWMRQILERIRKECGDSYPYYHCRRCGHDWRGRLVGKRARACPRCHSASWDEEPVLATARRPADPPNPKWYSRKKPMERNKGPRPVEPAPVDPYALPPPPRYVPPKSVRFGEEEPSGEAANEETAKRD